MPYESAFLSQAELGKCPDSTLFERKSMSTNKTLKRIALVAVASLGFGLVSVAPSNAAPTAAYTTMYDTTNGYQVVGGEATLTLRGETSTVTTVSLSGVGSIVSVVGNDTHAAISNSTVSGFRITASSTNADVVVKLNSAVTGTSTLTLTPLDATTGAPGTAVTKVVTWVGSTTLAASATNSTSIINAGTTTTGTADATVIADKATGTQRATIVVKAKDANGNALNGQTLSATISGPGLISAGTSNAAGTARAVSATLTSTDTGYIGVNSDGTAGVATITVSLGSTVIATETITFTGAAASYAVTSKYSNLLVGSNGTDGSSSGYAYAVKVTDANGNAVVDGTTVYATSGTTTVATITASQTTTSGYAYFAVTGVAAGSSTITFANDATAPTVTATATAKVTSIVASTVEMAFDKATYVPGEKMVLTITAKNASGEGIADSGTYTNFLAATATSNVALQGTLPGATPTFVAGVATYTLYAPLAAGPVVVTATTGTSANLATAVQGLALSASATVSGGEAAEAAQAAADAAAEAIDAANAATDAANLAAEAADAATVAAEEARDAADAATAAVEELATQVATLMAALKAQITTLANTVAKIAKKVKA